MRISDWSSDGCSSDLGGFLEPLESTSIHLIQTTIVRLLALLPRDAIDPNVVARFNRDALHEYETIRDFVIAHYALAGRDDTPFCGDVAPDGIPVILADRHAEFRATGHTNGHAQSRETCVKDV